MKLCRAHAAAALSVLLVAASCRPAQKFNGEVVDPVRPAVELTGVNWDGKPFRLSQHRGKVTVVFFGYTYCPDVCPFTLAKMKQLCKNLGDQAKDVDVVFASVDPQRDTVEKLAHYVPGFDPRFYGLRLEPSQIEDAAKTFDVTVRYGAPKAGLETNSYYYVDHTATYFVLDREGRLRLKIPPNATEEQIRSDVEKLLAS
jgi:protein SCO1/2